MSLLPPEVHSALSQLLGALASADNALRSQAEEQLNNDWAQNRPDVLLMGLVEQIQGAEETIVSSAGLDISHRDKGEGGGRKVNSYHYVYTEQNRKDLLLCFAFSYFLSFGLDLGFVNIFLILTADTHILCSAFPKNSDQDTKGPRHKRSQGTLLDTFW